ncbi:MAG: hypothetical protein PHP54_01650 [Clostridia bacterium]|nr:hypothetical protein [Clostridia bacterium]
MKKKVIIGIIIALCIGGLATLGYIITNNVVNSKEGKKSQTNTEQNNNQENTNTTNQGDNKDTYQNVVLNSRVGLRILEKFNISNIYSDTLYNELDSNGFSNKAKLLYTYITIISNTEKYSGILRVSGEYAGNHITKADFEMVAKSLFGNDVKLEHGNVIGEKSYDATTGNYIIMPIGFAGESVNFTLEVPYEIKEYSDRVEVSFYRVYCNQYSDSENIDGKMYTKLFYDKNRAVEIENTDNEEMLDPTTQINYVNTKISSGSINKSKLDTRTYTLKNEDGNYVIVK